MGTRPCTDGSNARLRWESAPRMAKVIPLESRDSLQEVLTLQEVAAWLKVKPRQVLRLGIPCLDLGHRTKRFLAQDVRGWLERRVNSARVRARRTSG